MELGSFTADQGENAKSLHALRALAARHPTMEVRLGHQALAPAQSRATLQAGR